MVQGMETKVELQIWDAGSTSDPLRPGKSRVSAHITVGEEWNLLTGAGFFATLRAVQAEFDSALDKFGSVEVNGCDARRTKCFAWALKKAGYKIFTVLDWDGETVNVVTK